MGTYSPASKRLLGGMVLTGSWPCSFVTWPTRQALGPVTSVVIWKL
jgi:hypothetical protein